MKREKTSWKYRHGLKDKIKINLEENTTRMKASSGLGW
jgi:hypothetical protein